VSVASRSVGVGLVLGAILFALLVISVGTGEIAIAPGEVVATLFGGGDRATSFVIETLRLPRALCGVLIGLALGASGAIFQSITRNPLGSPDIVGFIQGAAAGAVLQIVVFGGGTFAVALGAIVGGVGSAAVVYALSMRGGASGYRLILVGIGIAAMLTAVTDYLLTRSTLEEAQAANVWLTGSLNGRGWEHVRPVAAALLVLAPTVALLSRDLRMLELGDEAARGLGVPVERARLALVFVAVALCAVATASAGPIVFIALAGPQIARRVTRASGPNVAASALMGAVLLLAADCATQRIPGDIQLPVGVLTGVLGGLYLTWLLIREWRA
jgi:iron complex transport system permease protein